MRSALCILILALPVAACGPRTEPTGVPATNAHTALTRDAFAGYLKALQAHDYDGFSRYYAEDVHLYQPDGQVFDHDSIVKLESGLAAVWDWTMDVQQLVLDDQGVALRARMRGPFRVDAPDLFGPGPGGSPKAGETWHDDFVMLYKLRDGKITELHFGDLGFSREP